MYSYMLNKLFKTDKQKDKKAQEELEAMGPEHVVNTAIDQVKSRESVNFTRCQRFCVMFESFFSCCICKK